MLDEYRLQIEGKSKSLAKLPFLKFFKVHASQFVIGHSFNTSFIFKNFLIGNSLSFQIIYLYYPQNIGLRIFSIFWNFFINENMFAKMGLDCPGVLKPYLLIDKNDCD